MAERAVRGIQTYIDPLFYIPEGVDELSYTGTIPDNPDADNNNDAMLIVDADDILTDDSGTSGGGTDNTPGTPSVLSIIPPQEIRMAEGGSEVVDVIFEVEDIDGVTKYEVRLTKL